MAPNERKFQKSYAPELLRLAEADLKVAQVLASASGVRGESTLFAVQQAVEKAIKAVLCHEERAIPLTHDIYAILQKLDQAHLPPGDYALNDLTPYATVRRYEEGIFVISPEEIQTAIDAGSAVLIWAKKRIHG